MAHAKIIKTHENAYQLRVDGQPFFIKGADASGVANIPFLVSDIQVANQPTQPASKPSTSANNNKVNKL